MEGVNGTACQRPTSLSRQLPESSHPPAALTVSGDARSITFDAGGDAGLGVDTSMDAVDATGALDPDDDGGPLVAATPAPGDPGLPPHPTSVTKIATIATINLNIM